jgi:hypothetical protein
MRPAHDHLGRLAGIALVLLSVVSIPSPAEAANVYVPLSGKCRVANSFGGAGPLVAGVDRNINVTNVASYAPQGGTGNTTGGNSSTGCGIPSSVQALVISTSVVPRGTAGTLKVFMAGKTAADGNSVAFNAVDATTNDMIVPARTTDTTAEITLNSSRAADYILDVVGYFDKEKPLPSRPMTGFADGNDRLSIATTRSVRTVSLLVPGPGTVVANAVTSVVMDGQQVGSEARCALSQFATMEDISSQYLSAPITSTFVGTIAATRHFNVNAAGRVTIDFVCGRGTGTSTVLLAARPQLSVVFFPD